MMTLAEHFADVAYKSVEQLEENMKGLVMHDVTVTVRQNRNGLLRGVAKATVISVIEKFGGSTSAVDEAY